MNYKIKSWTFEAFEYDPNGYKPEWWLLMVEQGQAFEYKENERTGTKAYASFGDKRSDHRAFVGDYIHRDMFGRIDVYSARNFSQRAERCQEQPANG